MAQCIEIERISFTDHNVLVADSNSYPIRVVLFNPEMESSLIAATLHIGLKNSEFVPL
jgi:hypothetical protein